MKQELEIRREKNIKKNSKTDNESRKKMRGTEAGNKNKMKILKQMPKQTKKKRK